MSITLVADASDGGFTTSLTAAVPAGTAEGDLMLGWASANDFDDLTAPSGWAEVRHVQIDGSPPNGTATWLHSRTATASEPADYTWTWGGDHWHAVSATTWRGAEAVRETAAASDTGVAELTAPSLEARAGDMLVVFAFHWGDSAGTGPQLPAELAAASTEAPFLVVGYEEITAAGSTPGHVVTASETGRMSVVSVLLQQPAAPTPLAELVDDFSSTERAEHWAAYSNSAQNQGGRLELPVQAGLFSNATSFRAWSLLGSHIFAELVRVPAARGASTCTAYLEVESSTQGTSAEVRYDAVADEIRFRLLDGFSDPGAVSLAYDSAEHRWVRIAEDSGTITWSTSRDGMDWTVRRSETTPAWATDDDGDLRVFIEATRDSGSTDVALWDHLNVTQQAAPSRQRTIPTYGFFIDWDRDGGLDIGDFEGTLQGWSRGTLAAPPNGADLPGLESSADRAYQGTRSGLITWGADVDYHRIVRRHTGLRSGVDYTMRAWVWIPDGSIALQLGVDGVGAGTSSTAGEEWQEVTFDFTATSGEHVLEILPATAPAGGEQAYVDAAQILGPGEEVTGRVLGVRSAVDIRYGRDDARALSATSAGDTSMEVDNRSRDYTPDNEDSPIADDLAPGCAVLITATHGGHRYGMFHGHLDGYELDPHRASRSVSFTALDLLARLSEQELSTPVYPGLTTGQAMHRLLDAAGWPEGRRDIDPGATTVRWWSVEGDTALAAAQDLVSSEGPHALISVDIDGRFVFRDRHHRLVRQRSLTPRVVLRDAGAEPLFSPPVAYDIGWREIINSVAITVEERAPRPLTTVWEDESTISVAGGEVRTITAEPDDPVIDAVTPVVATVLADSTAERRHPAVHDTVLRQGQVSISLARTSGQAIEIRIRAQSPAVLDGLRLRARPVPVARKVQVRARDEPSIERHGERTWDGEAPWAGVHDARAIAELLVGQRSERVPTLSLRIVNDNDQRMAQILGLDLSDRVHIIEPETGTRHDHYVERIEHSIAQIGYEHAAVFGTERVRTQFANVFTFDDDTRGFDDGVFGRRGFDQPATLFVLDESNLDEGLLGH